MAMLVQGASMQHLSVTQVYQQGLRFMFQLLRLQRQIRKGPNISGLIPREVRLLHQVVLQVVALKLAKQLVERW